jgi:DNA-binding transcriptional ArsR family regulator
MKAEMTIEHDAAAVLLVDDGPGEALPMGGPTQGGMADLDLLMGKARKASDFLKALSHENRLMLLCLMAEKERSVGELETILNLRQPTVSQQLARLRLDGMVTTRRDGKVIYYSLASEDVRRVIAVIYDIFCGSRAPGADV